MALSSEQIKQQSLNAYNQWCEQWREQAKAHYLAEHPNLGDYQNHGVGRACLVVANGYTLEENIETIKKYQHMVDIMVCDKAMGHLLDHGITPDFVLLCDANVSYEKYMEPWKDQLKETVLFSNVCANPKWTEGGHFKKQYFFVNEDVLRSEREFSELSNCYNFIPAATNVSNAMCVFLTQSNNNGRNNFFGYDKYLMIGFDYSWRSDGGYYAFSGEGGGKKNYMKHVQCLSWDGHLLYTSNNLLFSSKWLQQYIATFSLPFVQCGSRVLFGGTLRGDLAEHMQYEYKPEDAAIAQKTLAEVKVLESKKRELIDKIATIGRDHYEKMRATL